MSGACWSLLNHYLTTLCIYRQHLETQGSTFEEKHLTSCFLYFTLFKCLKKVKNSNYITFTFALKSQITSQCVVVVILVVMMSRMRF